MGDDAQAAYDASVAETYHKSEEQAQFAKDELPKLLRRLDSVAGFEASKRLVVEWPSLQLGEECVHAPCNCPSASFPLEPIAARADHRTASAHEHSPACAVAQERRKLAL